MKPSGKNNNIAVVDLETGSILYRELTIDMTQHIGGAAVNTLLIKEYSRQTPLVLGTGPLTGGFAPGSCLMVASFYSEDKKICHLPVVVKSGPMLKLSGIDFALFLGRSQKPCVVVVEKGKICIEPADDLAGLSIPQAMKQLKSKGMQEVALVAGPNSTKDHGAACTSVFGGFDRCGLAGFMRSKNICAIVIKGGGRIPFAAKDLEEDRCLTAQIKKQLPKQKSMSVLEKMVDCNLAKDLVKKYFRHSHACFHCPVGCINYLQYPEKYREDSNKEDNAKGVFILDHQGFAALCKKRPRDAHIFMGRAMALGLDPLALSEKIDAQADFDQAIAQMENFAMAPIKGQKKVMDSLEHGISCDVYHRFGGALPQILPQNSKEPFGTWEERVAFAMIVGVCPIPLLLQVISPAALIPFITRDQSQAKIYHSSLEKSIKMVLN